MEDLIYSKMWEKKINEDDITFDTRIKLQHKQFFTTRLKHGECYIVKFGEDDLRPMWEDQINVMKLSEEIRTPVGIPADCPLCQPYDYWDITNNRYTDRRYLTKIVNPRYPEGFANDVGVWMKCPCILKGKDRERLKFKERRI